MAQMGVITQYQREGQGQGQDQRQGQGQGQMRMLKENTNTETDPPPVNRVMSSLVEIAYLEEDTTGDGTLSGGLYWLGGLFVGR